VQSGFISYPWGLGIGACVASILESLTDNLTITERSDWERFVQKLNHLVQTGRVRRITPAKRLKADNEEWYLDPETGEVYVYEPPDWPFLPSWQRVDVFGLDHRTMPARPTQ
jgi:hypothetical protein